MEIKCPDCNNYYNAINTSCPFCKKKGNKISPEESTPEKPQSNNTTTQCKYCCMMISRDAKICPHCQKRLKTSTLTWILTIFFIIIGIGTCQEIISDSNIGSKSISDICTLSTNIDIVPISVSKEAFEEWTKARVAKDDQGMKNLIFLGKVFFVSSGTQAKIIDREYLIRKVRILNGDKEGIAGWVSANYVK
jgi:RNA polymerase subunit RPABC4/transcription elongation factor Spt4